MMLLLFLFLLLCTAIAKGEDRLILIDGSNPCEGIIQIYHDNKLGYIGDKHWSNKTEDVVCKSTQCGKGYGSTQEPAMQPVDPVWLNEVECKGNERHLGECKHPGFGISQFDSGTLRKIQCSNKINISLDGYACAGAVKYSTDAGQTYSGYFCGDSGWDNDASNILCKSLKCGTAKEIPKKPWITLKQSEKMWADCSGIKGLTNLWQCATAKKGSACLNPATVICSDHEILQLSGDASNVCSGLLQQRDGEVWTPVRDVKRSTEWCERMQCGTSAHSLAADGLQLNCTDNVRVVLMDKREPSHCYGEVYIKRNNSLQPVCASGWTNMEANVVCKELRCGSSVLSNDEKSSRGGEMDNVIMHNVECSGKESSLWHCRAQRDQNLRCSSKAYVVCSESMEVKLKDTPGKCAGRLEIKYEGKWQRVDKKEWTDTNSDVVCNQLNCTKSIKQDQADFQKYSQGSGEFLAKTITCVKNDDSISKCEVKTPNNRGQSDSFVRPIPNMNKEEAVGITCEGHAMIFLDGDSCSGKVGINNLQQTYWLSGSNVTWNKETANTVCREMHCGRFLNVNNTLPGREEKVWDKLYSCSRNETSLFNCGETQNPKDLNFTIATVKCSGEKTINLSEGCLGYVNVCLNGKCGGVCANPWTDKDSRMLCTSQNCGELVLKPINKTKQREVKFKSVHCTEMTHNLTKCNLVSFDDNDKTCNNDPAYVVCSGSVKARFTPSREKCSGGLEINYENQWLPVCKDALKDDKTRHTICRVLDCGQTADEIKDGPKTVKGAVISEIYGSRDDYKALKQCMIQTNDGPCTRADLQCSSWSMFALVGGTACSGNLFVHSKDNNKSAVSTEGWTETMGNILCSNLNCGDLISKEARKTAASWTTSFSCAGVKNLKSIWDCEKKTSSSNTNQIFIKCQDEPKVNLSTQCAGEVTVNDLEVCNTNWEDRYSRLVCQELSCSNAIGFSVNKKPIKDKEYFHVNCKENHHQIGQCKRVMGKCEKTLVSVFCAGNVKFNFTEKCGGQIQVNYRNKWEKVCPLAEQFPVKLLKTLCENCKGYNSSIKGSEVFNRVDLETTLNCTKDPNDPMHCVEMKSCADQKPAEIYCNGYVPKHVKPAAPSPPPVGIILGVGLLLVLVIIIVVIIRICIVNKGKNISLRILRKRMSTKEVEIESGDYDNVPDMSNQMEDLGAARFREDGPFHSNNDVSDAAEMQPLNLQTLTAAEGEHLLQDVLMDKVSDGVTVEEEDPEEDYDDIEACPEFTEAEVHESPQESTAEEPLLVEGDDDYLVPGQDG
ncbi:scavenger receptor cysteine-rich type 1 protein M130 [Notothenia coriiceps]|uniref:Scavenger receptor cysteine-rich type 1 protein M130 n=1 Tax=Notothenia coriiceps TaxID=8208 RepID=A0A6I9NI11_9TELE|nr:PREDICTED: scavenger receptor cysteine-rich type 1 protein M130-like [Notothenia coriiceps]